jgi:hypothetical protein
VAPVSVQRRFADEEVRRILKGAAELQERSGGGHTDGPGGLTLAELRQIAEEAGIDARFVDIAASGVGRPVEEEWNWLTGGPMKWHFTQSVNTTLEDSDFERVLLAIRAVMGQRGELSEVFGRMEWSHDDGVGPVIIGLSSRDGTTEIDITATRTGEAGLVFGLVLPFGSIFGGAALSSLLGLTGAGAIPLIGLMAGVSYVGTRLFWKARSNWWGKRVRTLIEKVASTVQEAASLPGRSGADRAPLEPGPNDESEKT